MSKLKAGLVFNALIIGAGFAAYELLLTSEAKKALKDGINSVVKGVVLTIDAIEERRGLLVDDDQPLPNVAATNAEWEALGF